MRRIRVVTALISTSIILIGCMPQDASQLAKAQAAAESAKVEAESAKAGLEKARADAETARMETRTVRAELTKLLAKPSVSDESRSRIIALLEKAAKLRALTDLGIGYSAFNTQLAEVKSGSETVTLVGWPMAWQAEQGMFEAAMEGWSLGRQIWETKVGLDGKPSERFAFAINAFNTYGDKLKSLSELVAKRTGDKTASNTLEKVLKQTVVDGTPTIMADQAIQWCFVAASQAFDKSREGLRVKLKQ